MTTTRPEPDTDVLLDAAAHGDAAARGRLLERHRARLRRMLALRLDKRLIAIVRLFAAEKKPIAAICHAAQVLAAADVIRGRQVSGYAACAPEVRLAGGEYVETPPDGAIRDGNLVTGFAWLTGSEVGHLAPLIAVFGLFVGIMLSVAAALIVHGIVGTSTHTAARPKERADINEKGGGG